MLQDRLKWNEKYQTDSYPNEPAAILKKYIVLAGGQKALDIAAGNCRNALFLANQGYTVDAVGISDAGLRLFAGKHPNIHPICADFDHFDIPADCYDLIVNIKFLNRRLFPYIREGLAPGGILIFQAFLDSRIPGTDQPACRDYLLRENELLHAFLSLKILLYSEWNLGSPGGWDYQKTTQIIGKAVWRKLSRIHKFKVALDYDHPLFFPVDAFADMLVEAHKAREGGSPGIIAVNFRFMRWSRPS